jgi:hypothetical protein
MIHGQQNVKLIFMAVKYLEQQEDKDIKKIT